MRTLQEETVLSGTAGWAFTGAWSVSVYAPNSGGQNTYSSAVGATATLNVPVGATAVTLGGLMAHGVGTATYRVDGGAPININEDHGYDATGAGGQFYAWYRALITPPIYLNPLIAHQIVITVLSGPFFLDYAEIWDGTNAYIASTIEFFGHSILYGYDTTPNIAALSPNIPSELGRIFGATVYNDAIPGEDLTNGNNTTDNPKFWANAYSPEPGWRRMMTGASAGPYTWGNGAGGVFPATVAATNLGWALRPEWLICLHAYNDTGYLSLYDNPPVPTSYDAQRQNSDSNTYILDGACPLYQMQAFTASAAMTGGTFNLLWNGNTSGALSIYCTAALLTQACQNATPNPIPYSGWYQTTQNESGANYRLVSNPTTGYRLISNTPGVPAGNITITNLAGQAGGVLNLAAPGTNAVTRAASPAGAGFAAATYIQRVKEICWRMNCGSPNTKILWLGMTFTQNAQANKSVMDAALRRALSDPTIKNAWYCDPYVALSEVTPNAGGATYGLQDGTHMTTAGMLVTARAVADAMLAINRRCGVR